MSVDSSGKVIVIGGGAAGLMATGRLAERGRQVVLVEKMGVLGKKLRITGKGRCNITNVCDIEDIINNIPVNASFMYSALYTFSNTDLLKLFDAWGVPTKTERGGRVFPASDKAADVVNALKKYALQKNVRLLCDEATGLIIDNSTIRGVTLKSGNNIYGDSVIVATGGKSYPITGSTGAGYRFAKQAGHEVITPKPSLVPLETEERWVCRLMGLSLKNVAINVADRNGRSVYRDFGEMLFTHFGVSGPVILSASAHLRDIEKSAYTLLIDLKPALDDQQLDERLLRDFEKFSRKRVLNAFDELLPRKMIPIFIELTGIDPHKPVNQISRAERRTVHSLLKALPLRIKGMRPISEAIITSGGVDVRELDPSTMQSRLVKGLYFAGEVIDVDAYTGGFNLQIAFSTGYLAGSNA